MNKASEATASTILFNFQPTNAIAHIKFSNDKAAVFLV
uniref:Uncharacterized protein n=1 Tax=Rheinheimera sp. BAL341 TaxID=1708203 RepID=A0A486XKL3_9GAMM